MKIILHTNATIEHPPPESPTYCYQLPDIVVQKDLEYYVPFQCKNRKPQDQDGKDLLASLSSLPQQPSQDDFPLYKTLKKFLMFLCLWCYTMGKRGKPSPEMERAASEESSNMFSVFVGDRRSQELMLPQGRYKLDIRKT